MSYNKVINPTDAYRRGMIEALVLGTSLPAVHRSQYEALAHNDELLAAMTSPFFDAERVMELQEQRFGRIEPDVFARVAAFLADELGDKAESLGLEIKKVNSYAPDEKLFDAWHKVHNVFYSDLIHEMKDLISSGTEERTPVELTEILTHALLITGLYSQGWRVILSDRVNLIGVASEAKRIIVTKRPVVLSRHRFIGVVIHEVAIHALFSEHYEHRDRDAEEGLGTLVEQLTLGAFHPLRLYRYLAIAFAVGMDGRKRTARETYELLVEIRRSLRPRETEMQSRRFVATELVRAYRTLPTDIPGVAYLRDKKYIEHNARLWSTLHREVPTQENYGQLVAPWRNEHA